MMRIQLREIHAGLAARHRVHGAADEHRAQQPNAGAAASRRGIRKRASIFSSPNRPQRRLSVPHMFLGFCPPA